MPDDFVHSLLHHESLLVATHARPDGDAVGSQIALARFLERLGKKVFVPAADDTPRNLTWLDPDGMIETFDGSPSQIVRYGQAEAVIMVDANDASRLGRLTDVVASHKGPVYVVDHHPDPNPDYDGYAVDTDAASTGQLVYQLITDYDAELVDAHSALCLYAAIMTDTGSFRYGNVTPELLEIVADLYRRGSFTAEEVYNQVYKTRSESGQLLLGHSLQTLRLVSNGRLGYMMVTRRMFERTGASSEDVDSFTDPILAIEGVEVAILFMEVGYGVKMSFRSQGDIPVNHLAQRFGGGGHRNASGAFVEGQIDSVIARVVDAAASIVPIRTEK
jgi:phosphoesterase RecJ-like protein